VEPYLHSPLCAALALAQAILPSPLFYVKLLCTLMVESMNGVGRKFSDMILLQISFKHILINLTGLVLHKNDFLLESQATLKSVSG
jgi:hypothetical protein